MQCCSLDKNESNTEVPVNTRVYEAIKVTFRANEQITDAFVKIEVIDSPASLTIYLGFGEKKTLNKGDTYTISFIGWTIPVNQIFGVNLDAEFSGNGTYTIRVSCGRGNTVCDSTTFEITAGEVEYGYITVVDSEYPQEVKLSESFNATLTLKNTGKLPVSNIQIAVNVVYENKVISTNIYNYRTSIPQNSTIDVEVPVSVGDKEGTYTVDFTVSWVSNSKTFETSYSITVTATSSPTPPSPPSPYIQSPSIMIAIALLILIAIFMLIRK